LSVMSVTAPFCSTRIVSYSAISAVSRCVVARAGSHPLSREAALKAMASIPRPPAAGEDRLDQVVGHAFGRGRIPARALSLSTIIAHALGESGRTSTRLATRYSIAMLSANR
jgi:hypothetical protein